MDCENCENFDYNEETEEYECLVDFDEDEYGSYLTNRNYVCPYFRLRDDYRIVRKQN